MLSLIISAHLVRCCTHKHTCAYTHAYTCIIHHTREPRAVRDCEETKANEGAEWREDFAPKVSKKLHFFSNLHLDLDILSRGSRSWKKRDVSFYHRSLVASSNGYNPQYIQVSQYSKTREDQRCEK